MCERTVEGGTRLMVRCSCSWLRRGRALEGNADGRSKRGFIPTRDRKNGTRGRRGGTEGKRPKWGGEGRARDQNWVQRGLSFGNLGSTRSLGSGLEVIAIEHASLPPHPAHERWFLARKGTHVLARPWNKWSIGEREDEVSREKKAEATQARWGERVRKSSD